MIGAIMFFSCVSWSLATITVRAPCPELPPVNLNISAFTSGIWYQIARYPNNWESTGDCTTLEFKKEKSGIKFKIADILNKHQIGLYGVIDENPNAGTKGVVMFHGDAFKAGEDSDVLPVYLLDADFNSYAIAYECIYDKENKTRHDYAWVASRSTKLSADAQLKVNEFLDKSSLIDKKKLIWDLFTKDACAGDA